MSEYKKVPPEVKKNYQPTTIKEQNTDEEEVKDLAILFKILFVAALLLVVIPVFVLISALKNNEQQTPITSITTTIPTITPSPIHTPTPIPLVTIHPTPILLNEPELEISSWQTYKSLPGITFKYPNNWHLAFEYEDSVTIASYPRVMALSGEYDNLHYPPENEVRVEIYLYGKDQYKTLEDWALDKYLAISSPAESSAIRAINNVYKVLINDIETVRYDLFYAKYYFMEFYNRKFALMVQVITSGSDNISNYEDIIQKILFTLTFSTK